MKTVTLNLPVEASYAVREAYKTFRTNFLFCGQEKKVVALTSCLPNEGKSTLSLNLAVSLAETGRRVLLIDADMRKSHMSIYADGAGEVGLSHYLSGQAESGDVVCGTQYEGLSVIFAGQYPPNPVELLGTEKFQTLLEQAREEYDYVLLDTPPVGSVIDAAIVARNCDGVVLIVAADRVSRRLARDCRAQLEKSGCPILGAVLNMADKNYGKRYGKGYYRYYGQ